jgi:two-component system phosphate regulon sensor histidine kinase PhoR
MPLTRGTHALLALAVAGVAALSGFLLNGDVQASLVVLVCAVAAVLIANNGEPPAAPAPLAPASDEPKRSRRSPSRCW